MNLKIDKACSLYRPDSREFAEFLQVDVLRLNKRKNLYLMEISDGKESACLELKKFQSFYQYILFSAEDIHGNVYDRILKNSE